MLSGIVAMKEARRYHERRDVRVWHDAHPPLEGRGASEADREAGWGDLSASTGIRGITPPRSPAARASDPPPPGEGEHRASSLV